MLPSSRTTVPESKMIVSGDSLPVSTAKKCEKSRKLCAGKQVDLSATGDKLPNAVVAFLTCEVKSDPRAKENLPLLEAYEKCHRSIMGTGNYPATGRRHCGEELLQLLGAVTAAKND